MVQTHKSRACLPEKCFFLIWELGHMGVIDTALEAAALKVDRSTNGLPDPDEIVGDKPPSRGEWIFLFVGLGIVLVLAFAFMLSVTDYSLAHLTDTTISSTVSTVKFLFTSVPGLFLIGVIVLYFGPSLVRNWGSKD